MFSPSSATQKLTVSSGASASVSIDPNDSVVYLLLVAAAGGQDIAFVRIGAGAQIADPTGFPVLQNVPTFLPTYTGADTLAAVLSAAGPDTLYVTTGHDV